jgi:hypothetical protein
MEEKAKVKINMNSGEFEIEGSESFVKEYMSQFESLLNSLAQRPSIVAPFSPSNGSLEPMKTIEAGDAKVLPDSFGEFFVKIPKSATGTDQFLAAAYFVQRRNSNDCYETAEVNKILVQQGIKLANASQSNKNNLDAKRSFAVSSGKFRISQQGLDYLKSSLGLAI